MTNGELGEVLLQLATHIETAPVYLVGAQVNVHSGGGGSVTGLKIEAHAGEPGTHAVGMSISVNPSAYAQESKQLISDLREAANMAKTTKPPKSWISGLMERAKALGNKAIEAAIVAASVKIAEYYAGV